MPHILGGRKPAGDRPRSARPLLPHNDYPARARVERLIVHLHGLGARALGEYLDELCQQHDLTADVLARLEAYARITPEMICAVGADRFPPAPLRSTGS